MDSSCFAPAGRAGIFQLTQRQQFVSHVSCITTVLHFVPEQILALNEHCRIAGVSNMFLDYFDRVVDFT